MWRCIECEQYNSDGMKTCRCGAGKPHYEIREQPTPKPSRKMAKTKPIPRRNWQDAEQGELKIATRFGVERKDDVRTPQARQGETE